MKNPVVFAAFAALSLWVAPGAQALGNPVDKALGNLRWGMSTYEVSNFLKRQIKSDCRDRFKKAKSTFAQDNIKRECNDALAEVKKRPVEFNGRRSVWDASFIEGEFTHGNEEAMIVYKDGSSHNFYFFIGDRLWKWYKAFDASAFGGTNFKRFRKTISKRFGKGRVKHGVFNESGKKHQWVEYITRQTRLRALDHTNFYGKYALVFEEMSTVRQLASLRSNTIGREKSDNSAVAGLDRGGKSRSRDNVVDSITGKDRTNAGNTPHTDKLRKRRSLFAEEKQQESEEDYRARQKREREKALARQRRTHQRKQGRERAKALKGLSVEDDDPLGGL